MIPNCMAGSPAGTCGQGRRLWIKRPAPSQAVERISGRIVVSDQFNDRVIIIDRKGKLLAQYGNLNMPGCGTTNASEGLFAPYGAKVIGDYTGLTPP